MKANAEPDWSDLRLFLSVARTGGFVRAARMSGVSLATMGRRMQALEQDLGVTLFERLPDGRRLTAAGEALAGPAARIGAIIDEGLQAMRDADSGATIPLRIWGDEWEASFIATRLPDLRARLGPDARIELLMSHRPPSLARREADVLLLSSSPAAEGLVQRRLGQMTFAAYGVPAQVTLGLTSAAWIGFNAEHDYFPAERWLAEWRGPGTADIRVSSALSIHQAVAAGAGLGVLPCFVGDADPGLIRATAPIDSLTRDIRCARRGDDEPHTVRLTAALAEVVRAAAEVLDGKRG